MDWYLFALLALVFMGVQRFLYKVSAERRCNTAWTTFSFMGTVTVLSALFFVVTRGSIGNVAHLFIVSLVNSASFLAGTITHMEALKRVSVAVAYSIIRLNVVVVVFFSVIYFGDRLSLAQGAGVILALFVIVILTKAGETAGASGPRARLGLVLAFVSLFSGAVASVSSKFAATSTDPLAFMGLSYGLSTLGAFGLSKRPATAGTNGSFGEAVKIGLCMGLINFAGYYLFLQALATGPLSLVASITSLHFVIPILLSVVIYRERLTALRGLGVLGTISAVLLLRC